MLSLVYTSKLFRATALMLCLAIALSSCSTMSEIVSRTSPQEQNNSKDQSSIVAGVPQEPSPEDKEMAFKVVTDTNLRIIMDYANRVMLRTYNAARQGKTLEMQRALAKNDPKELEALVGYTEGQVDEERQHVKDAFANLLKNLGPHKERFLALAKSQNGCKTCSQQEAVSKIIGKMASVQDPSVLMFKLPTNEQIQNIKNGDKSGSSLQSCQWWEFWKHAIVAVQVVACTAVFGLCDLTFGITGAIIGGPVGGVVGLVVGYVPCYILWRWCVAQAECAMCQDNCDLAKWPWN